MATARSAWTSSKLKCYSRAVSLNWDCRALLPCREGTHAELSADGVSGLDGQLFEGGHVLDQEGGTVKRGKVLLAKIGEGTSNRLTRHADDLPDLLVGQGHFDSASGARPGFFV